MKFLKCVLFLWILALLPFSASLAEDVIYADTDVPEDTQEVRIAEEDRPAFVEHLLSVAIGELGYTEGPNNRTKYGEWSGDPNAAWCAEYVCWCVDQTDQQFGTQLLDVIYPNYSGQNTGRDWFIKRGRFVYRKGNCPEWGYQWCRGDDHYLKKNEFIPRAGDLVFFSYNEAGDTEHVALIEYAAMNAEGQVILHVLEGNNPSAVQRNRYYLSNSQILGFGLCEDLVDTVMRYGNRGDKVRVLQERLNTIGLLANRNITGTFGSGTKAAIAEFQRMYLPDESVTGIASRTTQQVLEEEYNRIIFESPDTWLVDD